MRNCFWAPTCHYLHYWSPQGHTVGSFIEKIGYVLRARVETLGVKETICLIINLVDLQCLLRLYSDVADNIFDGPLLDHRTGDNRGEFPLGCCGWARSRCRSPSISPSLLSHWGAGKRK